MKYPDRIIENNTHGTRSQSALIKTVTTPVVVPDPPIVITCDGATSYFNFSSAEVDYDGNGNTMNHTSLFYRLIVNDVDHGVFDLTGEGYIDVGGLRLSVNVDSSGSGWVDAGSVMGIGGDDFKVAFKSQPDLTDANFWGVDVESNPTLLYDDKTRSVSVCFHTNSNV